VRSPCRLRFLLLQSLFFFFRREMNSRLMCFVSIFCNLRKAARYCEKLRPSNIDSSYRLIEKIKCEKENRYVVPYGHGKIKKMLFPEFSILIYGKI